MVLTLFFLFQHNHKKKKVPRKSSENNQRGDTTQAENDGINADVDFWADQTTQDFGGGVDDDMMMDDFGDDVPTSNFDDDTGLDQSKPETKKKKEKKINSHLNYV